MYPDAISKETGCVLVKPTLQIAAAPTEHRNIFALGDVAETGGPKMARAGYLQAEVVCSNIIAMINGEEPPQKYRPIAMEGSTKLTLGKVSLSTLEHSEPEHLLTQVRPFRQIG
jgi:NADH dehydrogenase FAD-containing subunit